jgi:hypothetical protein
MTNRKTRHLFIGKTTGDFEQVLPKLLLRVGLDQNVLGGIVHASQVPGVCGVAATPKLGRGFKDSNAAAGLTRHEGCAKSGIAASNDQNVQLGL